MQLAVQILSTSLIVITLFYVLYCSSRSLLTMFKGNNNCHIGNGESCTQCNPGFQMLEKIPQERNTLT